MRVGSLGLMEFAQGAYCYVGSAQGGLRTRLARHLCRSGKSLHWHVDYLRRHTAVAGLACWPGASEECSLAEGLAGAGGRPMGGFGCSDCTCGSHLYRFEHTPWDVLADIAPDGAAPLLLP
jgi:sugar fermentation stimulation protein A